MNSILRMEYRAPSQEYSARTARRGSHILFLPSKLSVALAGASPNSITVLSLLTNMIYGGSSREKCFTMLKMVKKNNELGSTMSHKHIVALCLMAADFDVLGALNPD